MFTNLFQSIGDFFEWSFIYIQKLDNLPNYFFIAIGFIGFIYWMREQARYNREARESGGMK